MYKKQDFFGLAFHRKLYTQADKRLQKTFKIKKKKCYRDFDEAINFRKNPVYVRRKTKIFKNKQVKAQNSKPDKATFKAQAEIVLDKIARTPRTELIGYSACKCNKQ